MRGGRVAKRSTDQDDDDGMDEHSEHVANTNA